MPPDCPKTAEEWWLLFDCHKVQMRNLVAKYHPTGAKSSPEVHISAPGAEHACEIIREQIARESSGDPAAEFDQAVKDRDPVKLVSMLNGAWFGMPECMGVRSEGGFHALCDLCSESHCVLGDGEWEDGDDN